MEQSPPKIVRLDLGFSLKLLDRYVAREFLVSYLIAVTVVLSLRVVLDLFVQFDEFVETKSGQAPPNVLQVIGYIAGYYWPKLFEYFRDFSGMMILLAAVFSLVRMSRQNELTALLASGVSLKRVIAPIVVLGIFLNVLMVLDQEFILPRLSDKLVRRHDEGERLRSRSVWLLPDKEQSLFCSESFDPQDQSLSQMFVILRHEGLPIGQITAEKAFWNESQQRWELVRGEFYSYDGTMEHPSLAGMVTGEGFGRATVSYYPSALSADYLWLQRNSNFKSLLSSTQLNHLVRLGLKAAEQREAVSERHFRFTDPLINMAMLLLGLSALVSREQRKTKVALTLSLVGPGTCFIVTFACKLLGGNTLDPMIAAWLPLLIFMPLAILALEEIKT
jgi:lipopolysaccharide export system permease protein